MQPRATISSVGMPFRSLPRLLRLPGAERPRTLLPQRLPSLKAGNRLGNWELVELLGAGGFGEVWLAQHPSLHGLKVALKFCLDPAAAESLRHEAVLLNRVMQHGKHPGIVPLRQANLDREPSMRKSGRLLEFWRYQEHCQQMMRDHSS